MTDKQQTLIFENNSLLPVLYGPHNANLDHLSALVPVTVATRGNAVSLRGKLGARDLASTVLNKLYDDLETGALSAVSISDVDDALRMAGGKVDVVPGDGATEGDDLVIKTKKRPIRARTPRQGDYIAAIRRHQLVFGTGPAGTGKTFLAVALAVESLLAGEVDRIVLSRPAVEAGERLGFLPGDMKEKIDPYLQPLYDALHACLPGDFVAKRMEEGVIEIAPLAFMRGRTLAHAFVILDEAQNTTRMQMKMFLTRLGEGSRMVVTGDLSQVDLPAEQISGLRDAIEVLGDDPQVGRAMFTDEDVVRHPLVARIVRAYEKQAAKQQQAPKKPRAPRKPKPKAQTEGTGA